MIPAEILRKVRHIEIKTRSLVNDIFGGEYHSVFKGRGMTFSEVREYQPGDDIRLIDWNVTARYNEPFVKIFEEERELTVYLMVDISASGEFGSGFQLKKELGTEIAAVLGYNYPESEWYERSFEIVGDVNTSKEDSKGWAEKIYTSFSVLFVILHLYGTREVKFIFYSKRVERH